MRACASESIHRMLDEYIAIGTINGKEVGDDG